MVQLIRQLFSTQKVEAYTPAPIPPFAPIQVFISEQIHLTKLAEI